MLDRRESERFDCLWTMEDETWDAKEIHGKVMEKINGEISPKRTWRKKSLVVLLAAVIAVMGTISFGAERDWDIQFAEFIGAEAMMADLSGGYKEIDVSQTVDGITLTVSKSIGDQNSQWIQVDTNLPFKGKDEAWEIFESLSVKPVEMIPFAVMTMPFDANGKLAFLVEVLDGEKINREEMKLEAELHSGGVFDIQWKNYYAENTKISRPMKMIDVSSNAGQYKVFIYEAAVSPVSVKVKGWTMPEFGEKRENEYRRAIHIEAVTLKTGEVVGIHKTNLATIGDWSSMGKIDCYVPLASADAEARTIDGNEIISVTVSGTEIVL